jgi:hypothetical protein
MRIRQDRPAPGARNKSTHEPLDTRERGVNALP